MPLVIKATGAKEDFSEEKLLNSIRRAGISGDLQSQALADVKSKLYENIPTSEIYRHVTDFLAHSPNPYGKAKYSLKQAIMELGPTGYPFEDFIAEIFKTKGYSTKIRSILAGKCITHEIDVIAEKDGKRTMIEAKFHNMPGTKTDVHVALYTKARFDDIKENNNLHQVWLVTNTKITSDAISYAYCSGMSVVSWDYPAGKSLRDLIEESNLSPITSLISLSQSQKQQLLKKGIVFSKNIIDNQNSLYELHLPQEKVQSIIEEAKFLAA